jgi:glycosyltransferase involved in cell wall biosynthesis
MRFSVLISLYTKEDPIFFDRAMTSIWDDQVVKPNQIVLVLDGDITSELTLVVRKWEDQLGEVLTLVVLPINLGLGGALNEGLKQCKYDLVARMDSDDISMPQRFSQQVKSFVQNPAFDIVGSFAEEIDECDNLGSIRSMPIDHSDILSSLWAAPIIHPSVMYKLRKIQQVGYYDNDLRRRQDYDLWFRCAARGLIFHNIPIPLLFYRFTLDTHAKQSVGLALEQGVIGFKGASLLRMPLWKQIACFVPFFRSMMPIGMQQAMYSALKRFDPRKPSNGK